MVFRIMKSTGNRYGCRVLASLVFIAVLIYVRYYHSLSNTIIIPGIETINLDDYPPLGIMEAEEFPLEGVNRMEKIIHQTWKNTDIPAHYVDWVRTWTQHHPDWTYMFWTDDSARQLIADKHPDLLWYFDNYLQNIRRADAMRYVILYEYGGVYSDLDLESLQPLDRITRKYSCFLAQEPYEHPIIDGNFEHLVINAFLACKSKHPLMKKFMDNLPSFFHMWNVLDSTGPHYITALYNQYIADNRKLKQTDEKGVYLAPAEYFFPTIDPVKFSYMKGTCSNFEKIPVVQKRACVELHRKGLERKPYSFSFTDHHWVHSYFKKTISIGGPTSVFEIVPNAKIYNTGDFRISVPLTK